MTEGSGGRTKRAATRFFKNPPQPYMCIRDTLAGCPDPCYVNVLSWDKVATAFSEKNVSLYGGMKLYPSRSEKKEVSVFAVMAHPDVLKRHGKNTHNPMERTWLIDMLLDFVEEMNKGVVFSRCYRVLGDRDITGELKEIWMAVQEDRAKSQQSSSGDDTRMPVPQYSLHQDQTQQQQRLFFAQQQNQQQLHQENPQENTQAQHLKMYSRPNWIDNREANVGDDKSHFHYGTQFENHTRALPHSMPNKYSPNVSQNDYYVSNGLVVPLNAQIQHRQQQQQQLQRQQQYYHDGHTRQPPQYSPVPCYAYYHPVMNNALRSAITKMFDERDLFGNK